MLLGNLVGDHLGGSKEHRAATAAYEAERARVDEQLRDAVVVEGLRRRAGAPDSAELLRIATGVLQRIWERHTTDHDFLQLRVGTATLPSRITVLPPAGATAAGVRTDGPAPDHPLIDDVPVMLPLADLGVVGVAGHRPRVLALTRSLLGQLATLHSPRHVALVVLAADLSSRPGATGPGHARRRLGLDGVAAAHPSHLRRRRPRRRRRGAGRRRRRPAPPPGRRAGRPARRPAGAGPAGGR